MCDFKKQLTPTREDFLEESGANLYFMDKIASILDLSCYGKFLEIGCGTGVFSKSLAFATGWDAYGTEISSSAQKIAAERIECYLVNGLTLPFNDDLFSLVFAKDVLPMISNKSDWFKEINRVLKKGGKFISYLPSEKDFSDKPLYSFIPGSEQASRRAYGQMSEIISSMNDGGFDDPTVERCHLGTVKIDRRYFEKHKCGFFNNLQGEKFRVNRKLGLQRATPGVDALNQLGITIHYEWERTLVIGEKT